MGEFTINGTPNLNMILNADASIYKPVFRLPDSQTSVIPSEYGTLIFQHWKGTTSDLWLSDYKIEENATLYGTTEEQVIELQFMLEEGMQHDIGGLGIVPAPRSSFNLYHEPYVENTVFMKKGTRSITFDVHLHFSELQNYCSYLPKIEPFLRSIANGRFALLKDKAHPSTRDLMLLVNAILHAPSRPGMQQMILQPQIDALVVQALCYLTESKPEPVKASVHERKAVEEMRDYLIANPDSSLTIPELAKKFAINEFKLKILFKEVNGVSIHSFAIRQRMSTACGLLINTKTPISEIGYIVGYQTSSSFSEEFKEWFLITPSAYRRSHP